jgi:putative ABC transport system ATP-binding protein
MNNGDALIELAGINKTFLTAEMKTQALSEVSLKVIQGEYVSMEGASGSGKTTLLSILGLIDTPTAGEYLLAGTPAANLGARDRALMRNRHIGFIFQSFNLIGDLSVFDNVELPLVFRGLPASERRRKVQTALARVGMSHRERHMPAQLSGGQQQRVAVARAVAGDPLILLADEPTGNLDSSNGDAVMSLLDELHSDGATICMVTHNKEYARRATRTIRLVDGRVVDDIRQPPVM